MRRPVLGLLVLVACAARVDPALVRHAHASRYGGDSAAFWQALAAAVARHDEIAVQDPAQALIVTKWVVVERVADVEKRAGAYPQWKHQPHDMTPSAGDTPVDPRYPGDTPDPMRQERQVGGLDPHAGSPAKPGAILFRLQVRLERGGAREWRVVVDGEAALYRAGARELTPIQRGAPGEPAWVQGRIDRAAVRLHDALAAWEIPPHRP
jgi:hypothetical protein